MLLLVLSLFFTSPAPLDMPAAEAYLVTEDGCPRLDDRYDVYELWISQTVLGRWTDDADRTFTLAALSTRPPLSGSARSLTRTAYARTCVGLGPKADIREAIRLLSPVDIVDDPRAPRQLPRGLKDVAYWQSPTNYATIVCSFLPEKSRQWYLAIWELAEDDDYADRMAFFEANFLEAIRTGKGFPPPLAERFAQDGRKRERPLRHGCEPGERELLRRDVAHSITNYVNWHQTDAPEFTVIDDLPARGSFVTTLTNDLRVMRAKYAEALPSPIDGSNVLCVARIYGSLEEYLEAVDPDMAWTAAYWSPSRRELVASLSAGGERELLRTIRHEAFHQYFSYATSMMPTSPWLNEGYAQYFEDPESTAWNLGFTVTREWLEKTAPVLKGIFGMDYDQFYEGTDTARQLKYRLAWSVAVFIEKGAPEVRHAPFKDLKRDYLKKLLATQDPLKATSAAFRNEDQLKLFVDEWIKFWSER